jgi:hypothetical protein
LRQKSDAWMQCEEDGPLVFAPFEKFETICEIFALRSLVPFASIYPITPLLNAKITLLLVLLYSSANNRKVTLFSQLLTAYANA